MAKRSPESGGRWRNFLILLIVTCTCAAVYVAFAPLFRNSYSSTSTSVWQKTMEPMDGENRECCRGIEHTELWAEAVNWGSDFLVNSTQDCCKACKANKRCNSWVYCGDSAKCGSMYRQCWLKRQKDPFDPEVHDSRSEVPWTSGLVYDKDVGIVGLETANGTIHIQLLPECAPYSVDYILELLKLTHCSGCRIYRAEGRGQLWDPHGRRISKSTGGPPYAVLQGTLEVQHYPFKDMPKEARPLIKRGMVGWVGTGPDFFISLADHNEWSRKHTVFATVLESDMPLLETMASFPATTMDWSGVKYKSGDSVLRVSLGDYNTCNTMHPIDTWFDGPHPYSHTGFSITYFISGAPGHCDAGQKMTVPTLNV